VTHDLILKGGRVIDPSQKHDGILDVAFTDGKVSGFGKDLKGAKEIRDVSGNWAGFRKHVIEPSQARILAYLHVSHAGIYGFDHRVMVGESGDLRLMNPIDCARVADENRDYIVGIKVRVGLHASGDQGTKPLNIALQVADEVGMPLMAHIDHPPPSYEEVIDL